MEYDQDLPRQKKPVYCWGHKDIPRQKGIAIYTLCANRQRPFAHALHNAIFNTFRRSKDQFLYVVPPFVIAYLLMNWAEEKNKFLNTKEGRKLAGEDD